MGQSVKSPLTLLDLNARAALSLGRLFFVRRSKIEEKQNGSHFDTRNFIVPLPATNTP